MGLDSGYDFVDENGNQLVRGDFFCTRNNRLISDDVIFTIEGVATQIIKLSQSLGDYYMRKYRKKPSTWTCEEVAKEVEDNFNYHVAKVFRDERICGRALILLEETDLEELFGEDVVFGRPEYHSILAQVYAWVYKMQAMEYDDPQQTDNVNHITEAIHFYTEILQRMEGEYEYVRVLNG